MIEKPSLYYVSNSDVGFVVPYKGFRWKKAGEGMAVKKTNNTAVLLVHGILGRPEQFKDLLPLIPKKWYIRNLTLKGHGSTPEELGKYPVSEWKAEVHREAAELCDNYEHVYIVGHSLGTIFAIQESLVLPVGKLFLINVPLRVGITRRLFKLGFQVFFDCVDENDQFMVAAQKAYGVCLDRNIFHYRKWIFRYLELFSQIRQTRKIIGELSAQTMAFISAKDEMASPISGDILAEMTKAEVVVMPDSGHVYYAPEDLEVMKDCFTKFLLEDNQSESIRG